MTEEKSRKIMANNINKYLKLTGKTKADLSRDLTMSVHYSNSGAAVQCLLYRNKKRPGSLRVLFTVCFS